MWLRGGRADRQHDGDGPVPRLRGQVLLDAVPQRACRSRCRSRIRRMWVACSNRETIHLAAQLGIGALTFAFVDPSEAKQWVDDYYGTLKTRVHADRPRGQPQHRHGDRLLVPRRRARRRAARARRLQLLRLRARPPLHLRRAQAGPHRHLADVRGGRAATLPDDRRAGASARRTSCARTCAASPTRASTR